MKIQFQYKILLLCLVAFMASCSTTQKVSCPNFKGQPNKAAIAYEKMKKKEHKQMMKIKEHLSEKYKNEGNSTVSAENSGRLKQYEYGVVDKIDKITQVETASLDYVPELRFDHNRFTERYNKAKELAKATNNEKAIKRFEKIDKKIEKVKERIKKQKMRKSPHHGAVTDDPRKGKLGGIFGIIGFITAGYGIGFGFAIAAIVLGKKGLNSENRAWALTGVILGWITIVAFILLLLLLIMLFATLAVV